MIDARIFVCEENECRIGLGMEMANGCVTGALDEQFNEMFEQITLAYVHFKGFGMMTDDEMQEIKDNIITAIEEAPVLTREQFMEVVNRCRMLSEFSQQCDELPNLPMVIRDTPITYEEMENLFIELNPEIAELLEQINNGEIEAPEVETVEVETEDGLIQVIEREIDNIGSNDDITENPIIFNLIQDNDTYHKRNIGILPEDQETNLDITEEEHKSLFSRLIDKLTRR